MLELRALRTIAVAVAAANPEIELDDLVQIGALAAVEKSARYDAARACSLKSWQWKHAEWAMLEESKRLARRNRLAPMEPLPDAYDAHDEAPGPMERLAALRCGQAIARAAGALPAHDQRLLHDVYVQDLDLADVARARGITPGAVSRQHTRVIDELRKLLLLALNDRLQAGQPRCNASIPARSAPAARSPSPTTAP